MRNQAKQDFLFSLRDFAGTRYQSIGLMTLAFNPPCRGGSKFGPTIFIGSKVHEKSHKMASSGFMQLQHEHHEQHQSQSQQQQSTASSSSISIPPRYHKFPPACLALLKNMEGNQRCVDCGDRDPQWAAVSYGALLCLQCSGHHRSLGVQVSCVRSVSMDEWSLEHVINMLEGGNAQLTLFFYRHLLSEEALAAKQQQHQQQQQDAATQPKVITKTNVTRLRYKTKAALFYRQQMALHTARVLQAGPYRGREISRKLKTKSRKMEHANSIE